MTSDAVEPGRDYLAFTSNANPERARNAFVERFGVEPAQAIINLGNLLVGPIPETDATHMSHTSHQATIGRPSHRDPRRQP